MKEAIEALVKAILNGATAEEAMETLATISDEREKEAVTAELWKQYHRRAL